MNDVLEVGLVHADRCICNPSGAVATGRFAGQTGPPPVRLCSAVWFRYSRRPQPFEKMSSTPLTAPPPPPTAPTLANLRAELDRLDDGIHDLLMQRAGVVARIAEIGSKVP